MINSHNCKRFLEALDLVEVEEYELQVIIDEYGFISKEITYDVMVEKLLKLLVTVKKRSLTDLYD